MKLASINLNDQNLDALCILAMTLHKAPKGSNFYPTFK